MTEDVGVSGVSVRRAATKREREAFIKLPFRLYADDPHWVPPLILAERELLDTAKNPFFRHAEIELYLAWRDGMPVGRIAAIDDDQHNEAHGDNLAFFGFFEAEDAAAAAALLQAAEQWAAKRGRDALRGPANPSLNHTAGMLVGPFDIDPYIQTTHNPPTYPEWVEAAGYGKAKDLLTWWFNMAQGVNPRAARILRRIDSRLDPKPTIRPFSKRNFEQDALTVLRIFSEAWANNWGFVPPTEEEFLHTAKDMRMILNFDLAIIMELEGEPIAFCLTIPDMNQVFKRMGGRLLPFGFLHLLRKGSIVDRCRLLLLGVVAEHRQKGLELALIAHSIRIAQKIGWRSGECGWTLEDNDGINKAIRLVGGEHSKTYRMYEKRL